MLDMLDPFLMLDYFESDDADDHVAGFPTHPSTRPSNNNIKTFRFVCTQKSSRQAHVRRFDLSTLQHMRLKHDLDQVEV